MKIILPILILFLASVPLRATLNDELLRAARTGDLASFKSLISRGAATWAWDANNRRPVHLAAEYDRVEILKYLIQLRSDLNLQDKNGWTALHASAFNGNLPVVRLLAENGARVDAPDLLNQTPLFVAVYKGRLTVVQYLIASGASLTNRDMQGNTMLHQAAYRGHERMAALLLTNGADPNAKNDIGWTPLHRAVYARQTNMIKFLLRSGSDPDILSSSRWKHYPAGLTPAEIATVQKNDGLRKWIDALVLSRAGLAPVQTNETAAPTNGAAAGTNNP